MDIQYLREAILADPEAKSLADAGNDAGCAARMRDLLPKVSAEAVYTSRGLYKALGARVAEPILYKLETYNGVIKPQVARAVSWLEPSQGGLDFGDDQTLEFLQVLQSEGVLDSTEIAAIESISKVKVNVTPNDVSEAWAVYRPDGKIPNPVTPEPEPGQGDQPSAPAQSPPVQSSPVQSSPVQSSPVPETVRNPGSRSSK